MPLIEMTGDFSPAGVKASTLQAPTSMGLGKFLQAVDVQINMLKAFCTILYLCFVYAYYRDLKRK